MDIHPDPGGCKIEFAKRFVSDLGGSAGNIAVTIARRDVKSALISALSSDAVGCFVCARLASYGVDASPRRQVAGDAHTSLALAESRAEGSEVVIYRNNAADLQLDDSDLDPDCVDGSWLSLCSGQCARRNAGCRARRLSHM